MDFSRFAGGRRSGGVNQSPPGLGAVVKHISFMLPAAIPRTLEATMDLKLLYDYFTAKNTCHPFVLRASQHVRRQSPDRGA